MKHYLGICLVIVTVAGIALLGMHSCTSAVNQSVDHIRDVFGKVLSVQPQVTVNQRVVLTQTAPIAEFAVVTKEELVTIGLNSHLEVLSIQVPLTEKKITAEAVYRVKAGFDLREPFKVEIDPTTHAVKASMPPAKILSVEQIGNIRYHSESATLNRVTDEESTQILANLNDAAHDTAEKSSLKTEAQEQVTQRLKDLLEHDGQSITIEWGNPIATPQRVP